jgi:hypothetical protein
VKRLRGRHAELIGGQMVEPGDEFDETKADSALIERLEKDGRLRDVSAPKSTDTKAGPA